MTDVTAPDPSLLQDDIKTPSQTDQSEEPAPKMKRPNDAIFPEPSSAQNITRETSMELLPPEDDDEDEKKKARREKMSGHRYDCKTVTTTLLNVDLPEQEARCLENLKKLDILLGQMAMVTQQSLDEGRFHGFRPEVFRPAFFTPEVWRFGELLKIGDMFRLSKGLLEREKEKWLESYIETLIAWNCFLEAEWISIHSLLLEIDRYTKKIDSLQKDIQIIVSVLENLQYGEDIIKFSNDTQKETKRTDLVCFAKKIFHVDDYCQGYRTALKNYKTVQEDFIKILEKELNEKKAAKSVHDAVLIAPGDLSAYLP